MTTVTEPSPAVAGRSGHTATALVYMLSLATIDQEQARRIRQLVTELDDISLDRCYAARFQPQQAATAWMRQLADEERATWHALRAAAGIQQETP